MKRFARLYRLCLACAVVVGASSCSEAPPPAPSAAITPAVQAVKRAAAEQPAVTPATNASAPSAKQRVFLQGNPLRDRIDGVLDDTYENRHLNLVDHAAWQIFHGVVGYGRGFPVRLTANDPQAVNAIDHVLAGGQMMGWTMRPGDMYDAPSGKRRGLRAALEAGTGTGQGHRDQWLNILANKAGLPPEAEIIVDGETYTVADLIAQVQIDVHRNVEGEYSWTLAALSRYYNSDAAWTAGDGSQWSIEKLVELEADSDINSAACGGTHRLGFLALAVNRHLDQGGEIKGVWEKANRVVGRGIDNAKLYQNEDGTFSTNYLARPGRAPDLAAQMATTGHVFEFLVMAMNDEQLRDPSMTRAANALCSLFERSRHAPIDCGALYHAINGLNMYRQRLYGAREFPRKT